MSDIDYSQIPIEKLNLSQRSYNCLKRTGINSLAELLLCTEEKLMSIKNMGKKSVEEITNIINRFLCIPSTQETPNIIDEQEEKCILDCSISKLDLSNRSFNYLVNNGIDRIEQLIWLDEEAISNLKNIGVKSTNEILLKIKEIESVLKTEEEQLIMQKNFPNWIFSVMNEIVQYFKISYAKSYCIIKTAFSSNEEKSFESIINQIYQEGTLDELLENKILNVSTNWNYEFDIDSLKTTLPSHLKNTVAIDNAIERCEKKGKILHIDDGIYSIQYPSIIEFVKAIEDEREKEVLQSRLDGQTLGEIGDRLGLTRERVRQILYRLLNNHPTFKEDKYIDMFELYNIEVDEFTYIFDETEQTFYYLDTVSTFPKANKDKIDNMLTDASISNYIKSRIEKIVYKNYIWDKGKYIPKSRAELFEHYFFYNCQEKKTFDEIVEGYNNFLNEHGVHDEKLKIESRTYENKLGICNFALANLGRSYRYYDIDNPENDYSYFVRELALEEFMDKEISTLKLFREHTELMEQFYIHDEYELHNLLRKIWEKYGNCQAEFSKMPTVKIGNCDDKQQMYEFLVQNAPINGYELCDAYEETYGIKSALSLGYFIKYFNTYYHQGVFKVDFESFTDEQFEYMKNALTEDFYSFSDVKRIYAKRFPNESLTRINSHNIKLLGFQLFNSYILRKSFSATSYVEQVLTEHDVFNTEDFSKALTSLGIFSSVLYEKRDNREIIEFSPHKYLSIKRLQNIGVDKCDLDEYCKAVADFVENDSYFTIKSIRDEGFSHILEDLDFEDWFYSSVLIVDSKSFKYVRLGETRLLYRGEKDITLPSFFEWLLEKEISIDIYDFEKLLKNKYGIRVSHYNIIEALKKSDLYYDTLMEKVYIDYNTYFEEI